MATAYPTNLDPQLGSILTCPICNKEFKVTEDTKYIAGGGYTCTWKCFLTRVKEAEKEKAAAKAEKERLGIIDEPKSKKKKTINLNPICTQKTIDVKED